MVYRKKKIVKRRNFVKKSMTAMEMASKALNIALLLKRLVNVEIKNFDVVHATAAVPDGVGLIVQLTNIPQGDTTITRDGSNLKILSIYVNILIRINGSAANSNIRVALVQDTQTNQAIYTTADILSDVTNIESVVSPLNLDNQFRFRILHNKVYNISDSANKTAVCKIYKKLNMRLRYDASTSAIADLTSNSLSLLLISNEATNEPTFTGVTRLRFVDN